jgi:hypothetical protein
MSENNNQAFIAIMVSADLKLKSFAVGKKDLSSFRLYLWILYNI